MTGSSRNLGAVIAERLAAHGATVAVTYRAPGGEARGRRARCGATRSRPRRGRRRPRHGRAARARRGGAGGARRARRRARPQRRPVLDDAVRARWTSTSGTTVWDVNVKAAHVAAQAAGAGDARGRVGPDRAALRGLGVPAQPLDLRAGQAGAELPRRGARARARAGDHRQRASRPGRSPRAPTTSPNTIRASSSARSRTRRRGGSSRAPRWRSWSRCSAARSSTWSPGRRCPSTVAGDSAVLSRGPGADRHRRRRDAHRRRADGRTATCSPRSRRRRRADVTSGIVDGAARRSSRRPTRSRRASRR